MTKQSNHEKYLQNIQNKKQYLENTLKSFKMDTYKIIINPTNKKRNKIFSLCDNKSKTPDLSYEELNMYIFGLNRLYDNRHANSTNF